MKSRCHEIGIWKFDFVTKTNLCLISLTALWPYSSSSFDSTPNLFGCTVENQSFFLLNRFLVKELNSKKDFNEKQHLLNLPCTEIFGTFRWKDFSSTILQQGWINPWKGKLEILRMSKITFRTLTPLMFILNPPWRDIVWNMYSKTWGDFRFKVWRTGNRTQIVC